MSTVDNVRTIPLIVERGFCGVPMNVNDDCENGGYPFERESDRDNYLRSQLDDIAKRHPELAGHLGNFQQRDNRQPRDNRQQRAQPFSDDPDFRSHFPRQFRDRFEQFGFPFDSNSFDPEQYAQQFYQEYPEYYQQEQQQPSQPSSAPPYYQQTQPEYQTTQPQQSQQPQHSRTEESQNLPSTSEREKGNIQQSNSTDLGQHQEPAVNDRNQRSMSAPPSEKPQRFTSSINIPVNQPLNQSSDQTNTENMAQSQSHSEAKSSNERIIPIHIEGREEPVMPKNIPPSYSQPQNAPHSDRLFGKNPEEFTQFLNREPRFGNPYWQHQGFPEEHVRQQRYQPQQNVPPQQYQPYQQHVPQPKEDIQIPVQREAPVNKQHHPQQHQPPQQQQPPQQKAESPQPPPEQPKPAAPQHKGPLTPIEQIQEIQKEVSALMAQVDAFTGKYKNKQYLFLDEMLTRNLIKLDNIDTQGQENIRSARKEAIKCIEKTIGVLEAKASSATEPTKDESNMEVEEKSPEQPTDLASAESDKNEETQPMDTEVTGEIKEFQSQQQMELVPDKQKEDTKDAAVNDKESEASEQKSFAEEKPTDTCEGQESNLSVSEALKKFEGKGEVSASEEKPESAEVKTEGTEASAEDASKLTDDSQAKDKQDSGQANEPQTSADGEDSKEKDEKKDKKKGKKKVEKKEK